MYILKDEADFNPNPPYIVLIKKQFNFRIVVIHNDSPCLSTYSYMNNMCLDLVLSTVDI